MTPESRRLAHPKALALVLVLIATTCFASSAHAAGLNFNRPLSIGNGRTRPGLAAPAPSKASVASSLAQTTGLSSSQVQAHAACPAPSPGQAQCAAEVLTLSSTRKLVHPHIGARRTFTQVFPKGRAAAGGAAPAAGTTASAATPPQAGTPAFFQWAYDLSYLSQTQGSSDTVAIVDAYDDPSAESDLAVYRSKYGLAPCTTANGCFRKVNQNGQSSSLPSANESWWEEESLDVDAVSALCPNCHILLVEANSNYTSDLDAAAATAQSMGANQISNSWLAVSSSPTGTNSLPGATLIAADGDHGYPGAGNDNYPAASPGFTAAGGTSLTAATSSSTSNLRGFNEGGWTLSSTWGGGSGCDLSEPKPTWQADTGCTGRSYSDVSAVGDPNTGLIVYDSGDGGWLLIGGTSLASPLIAAYEAVTGVNGTTPQWAYTDSALLNDPQTGSSGTCAPAISYICNAGVGYDGPTGVGSISGAVTSGAPGIGGSYAQSTSSGAALSGGVYPNGNDTSYYWQYGPTNAYGQQTTATDIGSGAAPVAAPAALTGLLSSTVYHYRLVATNSVGTIYGYDYAFMTAATTTPPTSLTAPSITGTATQGQTLTSTQGSWNPSTGLTYAYQWQRSADGGHTWANIAGATDSAYTLAGADIGDTVGVTVTATDSYGTATASATAVGPVASAAPFSTATPTISGTPSQGQVLNVNSTWSPAGTAYTYQWQSSTNGTTWTNIAGATAAAYTLSFADESTTVRATVTATNQYGSSSATSAGVGPVTSNPPVSTAAPVITGTTQRTYRLATTTGAWSGPGVGTAIQWQRSSDGIIWTNIAGATTATYTLAGADDGAFVRSLITASNVDGIATQASVPTMLISPFPPGDVTTPTITGTPERTFVLTATPGTWVGPDNTYAYQWQRDFGEGYVDIGGATSQTYTLTVADEQAAVRVVVTATNPDGSFMEASQPTTTVLDAIPYNQTLPGITGSALRNSTLTASLGTWGGAANTYTEQWQSSTDGNTWANVTGATGPTYSIGVGDEGSALRMLVTATNADGVATATSTPTAMITPAPPVNTASPTISGSAQRSSTLSSAPGAWTGIANTYSYQWQRSSDGSTWTNISGATSASYVLAVADEGDAVRLALTAVNADGKLTVNTAPSATVQSAAPANTTPPTISGSTQRGDQLTATSSGTWTGVGNSYAYQWQRSSDSVTWTNIAGATSGSYVLAVGDEGDKVRLLITASNPDGSVNSPSAPTMAVSAAPMANTALPTITGAAQRGVALTSTDGTWTGVASAYNYQWQRSADNTTWTNINGATGSTYTVLQADEGYAIRTVISAVNPDGTVTAASAATSVVPVSAPLNSALPTVSGAAQRGVTLGSTPGTWTGIGNSYAYQWQHSSNGTTWANITGATGSTYTLAIADEGDVVRLAVTASNVDGSAVADSAASGVVQSTPPVNTVAPVLSGTAQRTGVLSVTQGTWTGVGYNLTYQWQHDTGSGFTNIAGQTAQSYTLGLADEGAKLRVLVTGTDADGTASAASNATSAVTSAPPVNTTAPTTSGAAQRTVTLTSTMGVWTGIGNAYSYQWQRSPDNGTTWVNINGATSPSYTLGYSDEGDLVRLALTATNPDGTVTAATPATAAVTGTPPVNSVAPAISGTARRASLLSSTPGTWTGLGNTYIYQWQHSPDNGVTWTNINGATADDYTLSVSDEGDIVRLLITATNADGSASAHSASTTTVAGAPPLNSAAPSLAGAAQRSVTLTSAQGTWSGIGNTYAYQWQRSTDGTTWTSVTGATGATYTVGVADEGAKLRLSVTATNPDGTVAVTSPATATVTGAPPVNTTPPSITGTPQRTDVLSATQGAWSGIGNVYTFQWQRSADSGASWTPISGASNPTYMLAAGDEGDNVRVVLTATNPDGAVSTPSAASATVLSAPPVNTQAPAISGTPRSGSTLTVGVGNWTPAGDTFTYDWQSSSDGGATWADIAGATQSTYALASANVGETIQVIVTATNTDGSTHATTAPTAAVQSPPTDLTVPAAPSGTLADGNTLTADPGAWNPSSVTLTYSWLRCATGAHVANGNCVQVGTGASLALVTADVGDPIAVNVTATSSGGSTTVASALTGAIAGKPLTNTGLPSISGNPQVPNTLTANPGTWSVALSGITYSWQRCDPDGVSNCAQVAGNAMSYTLSAADRNHSIVLMATATSPGRTATAQSAALTVEDQPLPQVSTAPTVTGTAARTDTLTATAGTWTNSPATIVYQWQDCDSTGKNCQPIAGATKSSYTVTKTDEGSTLTVAVTATNTSGATTASAHPTAVAAASPPVSTHLPVITGAAQQGGELQESNATWNTTGDTVIGVQWQHCAADGTGCQNIAGATQSDYYPLAAEVGDTLVAVVTAANPDATVTSTSPHTGVVLSAAPRWKALPTVSADPGHVGDTLTTVRGTWTGPSVTADLVQMMRCTNTCVAVADVTASGSYTIASADLGAVLRVRETAGNAGGAVVVWSSSYVGPVNSASAGSKVLGNGGQVAVRNSKGAALAVAQLTSMTNMSPDIATSSHRPAAKHAGRALIIRAARGITGQLRVWACPVTSTRGAAPLPCTKRMTVKGRTTIKLPASMVGQVRVVVIRKTR